MKHLRKFEELNPDVYNRAADKLKDKLGYTGRVMDFKE